MGIVVIAINQRGSAMSTYYYMACDDHKVRTEEIIGVERLSGSHIDNQEHLINFLMKHRDCCLKFFSEYNDDRLDYKKEDNE